MTSGYHGHNLPKLIIVFNDDLSRVCWNDLFLSHCILTGLTILLKGFLFIKGTSIGFSSTEKIQHEYKVSYK